MRLILLIIPILAVFVVSCGENNATDVPFKSNEPGTVVVFVHWNHFGLADMRVELVEPGIELKTNREGIAEFVVPAGRYTLRAYNINQGGPALHHLDTDIVVESKRTTRIEIVNCLPCV